jgi:DNA-binding CsgD family transcriptional regulator
VAAAIDQAYRYASAPFVTRSIGSAQPFWISDLRDDPKTRGPWIELLAEPIRRGDGFVVPVWFDGEPVGGAMFGGERPDKAALSCAMLQVIVHGAFARYRALSSGKAEAKRHSLTVREIQCLRFVASGKTDVQIGHDLGISSRTVRFHVDGAKTKLHAATRVQAIAKALQEKIISV